MKLGFLDQRVTFILILSSPVLISLKKREAE